jgi:hypothetical protein
MTRSGAQLLQAGGPNLSMLHKLRRDATSKHRDLHCCNQTLATFLRILDSTKRQRTWGEHLLRLERTMLSSTQPRAHADKVIATTTSQDSICVVLEVLKFGSKRAR